MPGFRRKLRVRAGDLEALRDRVAQLGDDPLCTERLLGQLSVVEAGAERHGDDTAVDFVPLRGCEDLASRALELVESA